MNVVDSRRCSPDGIFLILAIQSINGFLGNSEWKVDRHPERRLLGVTTEVQSKYQHLIAEIKAIEQSTINQNRREIVLEWN